MAQATFLNRLAAKRDAAKAEYEKWQGMIDAVTSDPDFANIIHRGKVKVIDQAKALASAMGGIPPRMNGSSTLARSRAAAAAWTPARRKRHAAFMKKNDFAKHLALKQHAKAKQAKSGFKKGGKEPWRKWTPERTAKFQATMKRKAAEAAAAQASQ